jgi:hypothetical protein
MPLHPKERRCTITRHIAATRTLSTQALIDIVRGRTTYTVWLRLAALRNLIADAPLSVTKGACYAWRRRAVRSVYGC